MKLLMLTPYVPYPPASGGQIRSLYLLKYLSKNHDITLICLYKNDQEKEYATYLKKYCKQLYICRRPEKPWQLGIVLRSIFSFKPFLMVRNYSSEAAKTVARLLAEQKYDVIHAETFYIMPHIPHIADIPTVLVEQTIEYEVYLHFINGLPLWMRPLFYLDIIKLRTSEIDYWKKASLVVAVSEFDQRTIKKLAPRVKPLVIPNGVEDEMFVEKLPPKKIQKPTLLFIGNFYWLQNTEAAQYLIEKIYPVMLKKIPEARVIIAGQNALPKLRQYKAKNIEILGDKPLSSKKIIELYRDSTVFIGPLFAPGGTNLKVLNAIGAGLPVVTTQIAAERLGLEHNKNVLIANTPEEFIQETQRILTDHKLYEKIRKNAYSFGKEKYGYESLAHQLEVLYRSIRKKRN